MRPIFVQKNRFGGTKRFFGKVVTMDPPSIDQDFSQSNAPYKDSSDKNHNHLIAIIT